MKIKEKIVWKVVYKIIIVLTKIDDEKIFFESFLGRNISGNVFYLYKYMLNDEKYHRYKKKWGVSNKFSIDNKNNAQYSNIETVERVSVQYLFELATAKYLIVNSRMPRGFSKRKNQIYIQTWHGTPLKRLAFDQKTINFPGVSKEKYLKEFKRDIEMWDYLLAQNKYSEDIFRSCFKFDKTIITEGYPRNTELNITKLEENSLLDNIFKKDKINVLYIPTFREDQKTHRYYYDDKLPKDFEKLLEIENINVIYRGHYLVKGNYTFSDNFFDLSNYNNVNDLYLRSDVLITDYSSVIFDYANLLKPMIFWPFDLKIYENDLRGLYLDYESNVPGQVVNSANEIKIILNDLDNYSIKYSEELKKFKEKYAYLDDEKTIERVLTKININ